MNRQALLWCAAGLSMIVAAAVPSHAHHSFAAEFDRARTITVTGSVTKLEWTNPHARLFVEGKDETGTVQLWDFELGPPNGLMRNGWNRNSLQAGHMVTVSGFRSKTSSHIANARTVTLSDGRQVFAGSSFDTGPNE
jgi:WD40 repeat protein